MSETFESAENKTFIFPDIEKEKGEILRASGLSSERGREEFFANFVERAKYSKLTPLTDDLWARIQNTDSYDVPIGGWGVIKDITVEENPDHPQDWEDLREKLISGISLDAPIVLKMGDVMHLVSGNTRLMVARAVGIMPEVLMVEM